MKNPIIKFKKRTSVISHASAVGKKEHDGPLGNLFDFHDDSDKFGQKTWEASESELQHIALNLALNKANLHDSDMDAIFAGDLINQCSSSHYGNLDKNVPFFGIYGACSTSAEGLILASVFLNGCDAEKAAVVTSSHNCSAERQFRFPLEYGGLRTPTSQWTVTASGAFVLCNGENTDGTLPYINEVLPGICIDKGITDTNNMGAAMAPVNVILRPYPVCKLRRYARVGKPAHCFSSQNSYFGGLQSLAYWVFT